MMQNAIINFLLQLCLATLAIAAPIVDEAVATGPHHGNAWQYGTGGGILGLIVLVIDIIVFIEVLKSNRPPSSKILWCLVVFLFPLVGMVIYWLFSNRAGHNRSSGYEPLA